MYNYTAICKQCREYLANLIASAAVTEGVSEPVQTAEATGSQTEELACTLEESDKSPLEEEEDLSAASDELTAGVERMKISDDSPILSPETASTVSSSGDGNGSSRVTARPRDALNIFLNECQIQSLGKPWLDWGEVSVRTRQRYVQRSGEIVAAVLKVISTNNAPYL